MSEFTNGNAEPENKIRFYIDSHIVKSLATQLRLNNVDVVRCQDLGFEDESDLFHFEYAAQEKRTIVTSDEDFLNLASQWRANGQFHAGVVYISHEHKDNVGILVNELLFLDKAIQLGAATLENDIYNQVMFIG